jgi:hypothetical protein
MVFIVIWDRTEVVNLVRAALCFYVGDGYAADPLWVIASDYTLDGDFASQVAEGEPCGLSLEQVLAQIAGYEQISPAYPYDFGNAAFLQAFKQRFDREPGQFANLAYDAAALVILAAEEAGTVDTTAISQHLITVSSGGVPVSDLGSALHMVREGVDIDWVGTYAGAVEGVVYGINHQFELDGETISPYLVFQIGEDGGVYLAEVLEEDPTLALYISSPYLGEAGSEQALAAYQLGRQLGAIVGQPVTASIPPGDWVQRVNATVEAAAMGEADLAWLNWLGYLLAHEHGMEASLVNIRFGYPYSPSQFWTHDGTGFDELADLGGASLCYVDPSSVSGYIIPSLRLLAAGVDPFANYTLEGSHPAVIEALYAHACEAGATYFDARDMVSYQDVKDVVLPLDDYFQIPNDNISLAAHLPPALGDALVSALLEIAGTPAGQDLLATLAGGSEGLALIDHSTFSQLETLLADAGMPAANVFEFYYP